METRTELLKTIERQRKEIEHLKNVCQILTENNNDLRHLLGLPQRVNECIIVPLKHDK